MPVSALYELHVYTHTRLMQPKCMKEQLPGMTRNLLGYRQWVLFDATEVGTPHNDVHLELGSFI